MQILETGYTHNLKKPRPKLLNCKQKEELTLQWRDLMDTIVTLPLYKPMLKQGSVAHGNWHMATGTWTCCRNKDQDARKGYNLSPITYKIRKSPSLGTFYKRLASCLSKMSGSGLSWWLRGEESTVKAEDRGSIPGPGRPPRPGAATPACHSYYARLREPGSHSH